MLWHKTWLETRWRFFIGLGLLTLTACGAVVMYPQMGKLIEMLPKVDTSGPIGRQIQESVELAATYRGYLWTNWFQKNLPQTWTVFAILLGTGGLFSQAWGGGTLFTLSLPISRRRLLGVRAATGLLQMLALAIVPSLLLPLFSLAIGQRYGVGDVLVHSVCVFVAGSVFYCLAFLMSTLFNDVWRPILITLCAAIGFGVLTQVFPEMWRFSVFRLMSAESYFRGNGLPWLGLLASAAASVAMLYAADRNIARRDF